MSVQLAWGNKRLCQECGERYYDFHKSPITCPTCGTNYQIAYTSMKKKKGAEDDFDHDLDSLSLGEDLGDAGLEDSLIEDEDDLDSNLDNLKEGLDDDE